MDFMTFLTFIHSFIHFIACFKLHPCCIGSQLAVTSPSEMSRRVRAGSTVNLPCNTSRDDHYNEPKGPGGSSSSRDVIASQRARVAFVTNPSAASTSAIAGYEWRKDDEMIAATDTIGSDVIKRYGSSRFSIDGLNGSLTVRNVSSAADVGLYVCTQRWRQRSGTDSSRRGDTSVSNLQPLHQQSRHIQLIVEGKICLWTWHHYS